MHMQMWMSVWMGVTVAVIMQRVTTVLETTAAHAWKDSKEMDLYVQVRLNLHPRAMQS